VEQQTSAVRPVRSLLRSHIPNVIPGKSPKITAVNKSLFPLQTYEIFVIDGAGFGAGSFFSAVVFKLVNPSTACHRWAGLR